MILAFGLGTVCGAVLLVIAFAVAIMIDTKAGAEPPFRNPPGPWKGPL